MSDEVRSHAGNLGGEPNVRVPAEVAAALDIEIGDGVTFEIEDDRAVLRRGGAPSDTAE